MNCRHVCKCDCHTGHSMHMINCCVTCKTCSAKIVRTKINDHREECHQEKSDEE